MKKGYTYILTNKNNAVLYIGVTSDLIKRVYEHKQKFVDGFSKKYNLDKLVYFETYEDIEDAIVREKQLKKWNRIWKERIINSENPSWTDLYEGLLT
ncbi:putative endonuclease [Allofrancisella inopinata]|uniref:GIY-YIG nuclease family protein n=1 Tax=Allofrancisella inopinata TaxID=1085647 RepID=A0AAE6YH16_9GAMM|nr:GIY-YIG nuclease family protein [Allofrancisella inopinata]QIV95743.1 GIY-YIG nuclease family protein [Allofrancisella inopinata]TDT67969.1 putative endonuclease [Allofrancisella inopinata]